MYVRLYYGTIWMKIATDRTLLRLDCTPQIYICILSSSTLQQEMLFALWSFVLSRFQGNIPVSLHSNKLVAS
jgi:hypothetical protein